MLSPWRQQIVEFYKVNDSGDKFDDSCRVGGELIISFRNAMLVNTVTLFGIIRAASIPNMPVICIMFKHFSGTCNVGVK